MDLNECTTLDRELTEALLLVSQSYKMETARTLGFANKPRSFLSK